MTTATSETLVISRAVAFELLATINAAGSLISHVENAPDRSHLSDAMWEAEERFRSEIFGDVGDELDEFEARASEIEADLLATAWEAAASNEAARGRYECEHGRPAQLRALAERIREVGLGEARMPTKTELYQERQGAR